MRPSRWRSSPWSPSRSAGSRPAGSCARWPPSPPPPAGSRPATCTSGWPCAAPTTGSKAPPPAPLPPRLDAAFDAQRHFAANASHELRTPLTRERALLQVALDDPGTTPETWRGVAREVLASNTEQESLIEALLALASGEGGLGQRDPVNLAAITGQILRARRPDFGHKGLRVEAAVRPAALDGDPLLTERLVANLVDNAVSHNIAAAPVRLTPATPV